VFSDTYNDHEPLFVDSCTPTPQPRQTRQTTAHHQVRQQREPAQTLRIQKFGNLQLQAWDSGGFFDGVVGGVDTVLADGGGNVARKPFPKTFCEVFAAGDGEVIKTGFVND